MAVGMDNTGKCLTVRPGSLKDSEMLWHFCREQTREEFQMWGADFVYQYPPEKEQIKNSLAQRLGIRKDGDEATLLGKDVAQEGKEMLRDLRISGSKSSYQAWKTRSTGNACKSTAISPKGSF